MKPTILRAFLPVAGLAAFGTNPAAPSPTPPRLVRMPVESHPHPN